MLGAMRRGSEAGSPADGAVPDATAILDTSEAGAAAIRGGAIRVAGYGAGVALSVLSFALLTRYLGVSDFGRYATVFSLVAIVGGLAEGGMTNIGVREYAVREVSDRVSLIRNLLGIRIAVAGVGVAAATAFAAAAGYGGTMVAGTAIGGLGLALVILQQTYSVPLTVALRIGTVAALDLLRQATAVTLVVTLVLAGASLLALFAIPVPAALAVLTATLLIVRRQRVPLVPAFDLAAWRALASFLAPFAAATAVGIVYVQLLVILLSVLSTEHETGIFGASFRVFFVLASVAPLMVAVTVPVLARAARDNRERFAYAVQRIFETNLILGVWFAIVTVLGAPIAIAVIGGSEFDASIGVLRVQAAALGATFLLATLAFALISLHRHRALLLSNLFALAVTLVAGSLLVSAHGAQGAAVASIVGEASLACAYAAALLWGRDRLRLSLRVVPAVLLAGGAAGALALVPGLPAVPLVFAATLVYFAILVVLRTIPGELIEALSTWRGAAAQEAEEPGPGAPGAP